jgi:6-phosphogluconolactonase (cycloisomerase 2 family)
MKLRKLGQVVLASAVGIGSSLGLTSCVESHTIGYFFVTGVQYNQVQSYKINNNTGNLTSEGVISSNGVYPVDAITAESGRYLYVLNAGCADATLYPQAKYPCASGESPTASSIALFSIGGEGKLTFQESYSSHGLNSVSISLDSTGSYLYVLDQNTPANSTTPSQYASVGDVSVFSINPNTGRLSSIQNLQLQDTTGAQLLYFPTGESPVWFKQFGSYLYTIDRGLPSQATANPTYISVYSIGTSGQLLQTPNAEFPTGAVNLVYLNSGGSYLYALDQGEPNSPSSSLYNGAIYIYTSGTSGAPTPIVTGPELQGGPNGPFPTSVNPTVLTQVGNGTSTFVYVANAGLNTSSTEAASNISSYIVQSTGQLAPIAGSNSGTLNSGTGSGPRCILVDPSNQFLFTANYNASNITGKIINTEAGALTPERGTNTVTAPGLPTWCVASGNTF